MIYLEVRAFSLGREKKNHRRHHGSGSRVFPFLDFKTNRDNSVSIPRKNRLGINYHSVGKLVARNVKNETRLGSTKEHLR